MAFPCCWDGRLFGDHRALRGRLMEFAEETVAAGLQRADADRAL
jgi:hypothetical protein